MLVDIRVKRFGDIMSATSRIMGKTVVEGAMRLWGLCKRIKWRTRTRFVLLN